LVAEPDTEDSNGYYLYQMEKLNSSEFGDMYFQSLTDLFQFAQEAFLVNEVDWVIFDTWSDAIKQ
jgi:hypothetical protein